MKVAPARTSATRCGPLTARQRSWAASISLNAIASPAAREPGPRVIFVRCWTVANVLSRVRGPRVDPVLGGKVVERQQLVQSSVIFATALGNFAAVGGLERLHRVEGVTVVLGVPDLGQRLPRPGVRALGQGAQHVGDLVEL